MAITMTDAAAHVSSFMINRGKGIGLRLGVKTPAVPCLCARVRG
jgi:iron-sulfur cluster assembly protein